MIATRLQMLLQRATAVEGRVVMAAAGSVAAVLALSLGLSAARSSPVGSDEGAHRVAAITRGDLREAALQALVARMDPASASLARRFDPAEFTAEDPLVGFRDGDPALLLFKSAQDEEARRLNAAIPFAGDGVAPAAPFVLGAGSGAERERAVRCLTNAIYYEAALEPIEGQRAVAQVVLNRVRDPNFPKSICGVVYQGWEKLTGCQFSFTCDGALVRQPLAVLWREQRKVAEAALNGYVAARVGTATHYHADYVSPYWAPTLVKMAQIGAHIFYRWPGAAGLPGAFTAHYSGGEMRLSEAVLSGKAARAAAPPTVSASLASEVRTIAVADGKGGVVNRVQGRFAPAEYGRRTATPEEVARINAILEARFPTVAPQPAEPAAPAGPSQPQPAAAPSAG